MKTQQTIETAQTNPLVRTLDANAQQHVLGGMASTTAPTDEREATIRGSEIFRLEIE